MSEQDYEQRFGGIRRLYGEVSCGDLSSKHVCVVGVGGVGSWAVEALVRSGIGELTLIDLDDLCITNVNRQIHALTNTIGHYKVDVLAERCREIFPSVIVHTKRTFVTHANASEIVQSAPFDAVLDAIDNGRLKARLIANCRDAAIPIVTVGGAGGKSDPAKVCRDDVGQAFNDTLLAQVRRELRSEYGYPKSKTGAKMDMGIPCVFSSQRPAYPAACGGVTTDPDAAVGGKGINCNTGFGTSTPGVGAFGLAAAASILDVLMAEAQDKNSE